MPLVCVECNSRVERSVTDPGILYCSGCEKEVKIDETYKVGKRFFAGGFGAMLAMAALVRNYSKEGVVGEGLIEDELVSTFSEMKRQRRKKLKGLKMKQRRHMRQKGGKK